MSACTPNDHKELNGKCWFCNQIFINGITFSEIKFEDSPCMETKSPEELTGEIEGLKLRVKRLEQKILGNYDDE